MQQVIFLAVSFGLSARLLAYISLFSQQGVILSEGSLSVSGSELFLDSSASTTGYKSSPYSSLKSDKRSGLYSY